MPIDVNHILSSDGPIVFGPGGPNETTLTSQTQDAFVAKYAPYASFIRELTFRSLDGHNLTLVCQSMASLL